ncbi:glycosyltransferase [Marinobacter halodurans]|uniref:Glycosyltransferase n=1 Tax=Marinobacter halodurans TaxID=2528979 RepID=A0ABY1ZPC8_9GAMM|nr:glycosyltransferase [Marinobacter halodurans]TBW55895.1 glycosyltransferase [Marinobacter halodurans]
MSEPLRIALILATPGTTWGGMETHTLDLARSLAQRGHEVHLLADARYHDRFIPFAHFHPIPVHFSRRHPWLGLRLRRILARLQPDICHAQGNKAIQLLAGVKRRQGNREVCYVGTVHGTKSAHRGLDRLDGVIAVSDELAVQLTHPRVWVIYNGIDPRPLKEGTDWPIPETSPLVIATGRLEPVKGFDRLIQAWSAASGGNVQLAILGEGHERSRLEALVRDSGQTGTIHLPGYESNVAGWLARADACVISSEREGFPYIMVEALLNGCPLLATPVSGVSRFLPADCIASSTATADLATLLRDKLATLSTLRQTQQASFEQARHRLTLDAMTEQTLAVYRELTLQHAGG